MSAKTGKPGSDGQRSPPTALSVFERAFRLANVNVYTVALQVRRLCSTEPEDETFLFRKWADFDFLAVGLVRLRRSVELACELPEAKTALAAALNEFDNKLPSLTRVRNVAEHIDDYALERGRDKAVPRGILETSELTPEGPALKWHGGYLHAGVALAAAEQLFVELQAVKSSLRRFP